MVKRGVPLSARVTPETHWSSLWPYPKKPLVPENWQYWAPSGQPKEGKDHALKSMKSSVYSYSKSLSSNLGSETLGYRVEARSKTLKLWFSTFLITQLYKSLDTNPLATLFWSFEVYWKKKKRTLPGELRGSPVQECSGHSVQHYLAEQKLRKGVCVCVYVSLC